MGRDGNMNSYLTGIVHTQYRTVIDSRYLRGGGNVDFYFNGSLNSKIVFNVMNTI